MEVVANIFRHFIDFFFSFCFHICLFFKSTDIFLLRAIGFNARSSLLIAIALGIEAASFWSEAEKDIAESPTASPERPKQLTIDNWQLTINSWQLTIENVGTLPRPFLYYDGYILCVGKDLEVYS